LAFVINGKSLSRITKIRSFNRESVRLEPDALRSRLDGTTHDDAATAIGGSDFAEEIVGWL
jgi:hypothetical protein